MAQMQGVQESLHSDIAALDSRFEDMPSTEQFEQLEQRQQQLEQRFDTFSTAFTGFSNHFYSVFPAPVPPPEFYRTSRSTHRHLLHRRWTDLFGN